MAKIGAVLGLLVVLLFGVALTDPPLPPADLTFIENVDPNTLDPQRMSYQQDFRLCYGLFEGLLRWDIFSEDFHVVPSLARRWSVSEDGLVYTFHLEPSAKWSNGDPVTAHDFIYSWRRAMMPETAADYSALFFCIQGAEEFFAWRVAQLDEYGARPSGEKSEAAAIRLRAACEQRFMDTVGLRAIDDHTLEVTLARPTAYFLDLCAFGPFFPVHRRTVEAWVTVDPMTGALAQAHGWTKPEHWVSNGPYVITHWKFKRELRLELNPHYWRPEIVRSETVRVVYIEDMNTSILAYETGVADWHSDTEVEYIGDMLRQKRDGLRDDVWNFSTFGTYFWSFNCTPRFTSGRENPFFDARVRRAFALAVNKQDIVSKVKRSEEKVAHVLVPPGSIGGFESPRGLRYDPDRARRELADAGWIDRDGDGVPENERGEAFPVVELLCTAVGPHKNVAQAMGDMWERELGIKSKVAINETKVYRHRLHSRDYMMARGGWYGDYLDPTTFLYLHYTDDGQNDRGYSNPEFDALLDEAAIELDPEKRMALLSEAERFTMDEELPVLPLWHYDQYYMYEPPSRPDGTPNPGGLRNLSTHPRLVQYLWLLEVVEEGDPARPDRDTDAFDPGPGEGLIDADGRGAA